MVHLLQKFPSIEGNYSSGVCFESNVLDLAVLYFGSLEVKGSGTLPVILASETGELKNLATRLLGGGGEGGGRRRAGDGMNSKSINGSKVLCNNCLDGFCFPSSFDLHCLTLIFFSVVGLSNGKIKQQA